MTPQQEQLVLDMLCGFATFPLHSQDWQVFCLLCHKSMPYDLIDREEAFRIFEHEPECIVTLAKRLRETRGEK